MLFVLLLGITVLVILLELSWSRKKSNFPTAPTIPVIGNLIDLMPDNLLKRSKEIALQFGKIVELRVLSKRIVLVSDVLLAKEILSKRPKQFRRPRSFDYEQCCSNAIRQRVVPHLWFQLE